MNRAHDRVDAAGMLEPLLAAAAAVGASDLHLSGGAPPLLRVDGTLRAIPEAWLDPAEIERICFAMLGADHGETLQRLGAADFACETSVGRVRVNIYRRRDSVAACLRLIAQEIPPLSSLGLPGAAERLVDLRHGLVLVTGATGNGKSTTLAAMVRALLERRAIHVLTIEDPIEVVHRPALGLVNQRELGADTPSFAQALRHALRQDPDVVLVGELR
ncbi:MAG TPA: ATPase, T2SS/T4P/T4SS family, partial [Terriglobales bacterium]|nr:ATPase, T2SS/T4P/T4SS family [Terriglobales bacterium]